MSTVCTVTVVNLLFYYKKSQIVFRQFSEIHGLILLLSYTTNKKKYQIFCFVLFN